MSGVHAATKWVLYDGTQNQSLDWVLNSIFSHWVSNSIFPKYIFLSKMISRKCPNIDKKLNLFQHGKAIWSKVEVLISKMFTIYVSLYMWKLNLQQKMALTVAAWSPACLVYEIWRHLYTFIPLNCRFRHSKMFFYSLKLFKIWPEKHFEKIIS